MAIPIYNLSTPDQGLAQSLANLPTAFMQGFDQAQKRAVENQKRQTLADLANNPNADYAKVGLGLLSLGDTQGGAALLQLAEKQKEAKRVEEWQKNNGLNFLGGGSLPSQNGVLGPVSVPPKAPYKEQVAYADNEADVQRLEGSVGTPAQKFAARLMNNGVPAVMAAGLSSNVGAESNFNPVARNPGDGRDGSDSIGVAQWNGPRAQALQSYAAQRGEDWRDPNVQADFMAYELRTTERDAATRMAGANTPQEAAAGAVGFFRPQGWTANDPSRSSQFQRRVAGADAAMVPLSQPQLAQAPTQAVADMPAPGVQEAQFVIPGTGENLPVSLIEQNPRLRAALQGYMTAPNAETRAQAKAVVDVYMQQHKEQLAANKPTDAQRNYELARRQGYQGSFMDYQKEMRAQTTVNVNSGEKTYDQSIGKAYADQFIDVQKAGRDAGRVKATLGLMENLMRDPNFHSGFGGERALAVNRALVAAGIKDAKANSATEAFQALANQTILDASGGSLGAQISNSDRDFISSTAPNLANTPEGNRRLIEIRRKLADRQIEVAKMAREYAKANGGRIDAGFEQQLADFAEKNPLFPRQSDPAPGGDWNDLGNGVRFRKVQ